MSLNKLTAVGNLTKDPEMKEVGGVNCLNFTLASDSRNKGADGKPTTNFYNCTAWRQAAETIGKYVHKGDKLGIVGDLFIRNYKDNNGNDRMAVCVNVTDFEFLSSRSGNAQASSAYAAPQQAQRAPASAYTAVDEELPF